MSEGPRQRPFKQGQEVLFVYFQTQVNLLECLASLIDRLLHNYLTFMNKYRAFKVPSVGLITLTYSYNERARLSIDARPPLPLEKKRNETHEKQVVTLC